MRFNRVLTKIIGITTAIIAVFGAATAIIFSEMTLNDNRNVYMSENAIGMQGVDKEIFSENSSMGVTLKNQFDDVYETFVNSGVKEMPTSPEERTSYYKLFERWASMSQPKALLLSFLASTKISLNIDYLYFGIYIPSDQLMVRALEARVENREETTGYFDHVNITEIDATEDVSIYGLSHENGIDVSNNETYLMNAVKINLFTQDESQEDKLYSENYVPYLVAKLSKTQVDAKTMRFVRPIVFIIVSLMVVLDVTLIVLIYVVVTKRIRKLNNDELGYIEALKNDNVQNYVFKSKTSQKGDEISDLSSSFIYLGTELNEYLARMKEALTKDEKMKAEMNFSKEIQQSLLPQGKFSDASCSVFAEMIAAKEVGGDLYDYFVDNQGRIVFLVGDVSGKGVPASLFMVRGKTLLHHALINSQNLKETINEINDQICENNIQNLFITAFIGRFDKKTHKFEFVNCGHVPAYICDKDGYKQLEGASNIPLGCISNFDFDVKTITLKIDERIFAYTDGVNEALDSNNNLFGYERLNDALNETRETNDLVTVKHIINKVNEYSKGVEQADDICCLSFTFLGEESKEVASTKEGLTKIYSFIEKRLKHFKVDENQKSRIMICMDELLSNILNYAYEDGGSIELHISDDRENITFYISDFGKEFDPTKVEAKETDGETIGGLGIGIVKAYAKEFAYKRIDETNCLKIKFCKNS